MDQNEFNKLFEEAVKAYLEDGGKLPFTSPTKQDVKDSKASASSSAKTSDKAVNRNSGKDKGEPKVFIHKDKGDSQQSAPSSSPSTGKEDDGYTTITLTHDQIGEMYVLLTDLCQNLLDVNMQWESIGRYTHRIFNLINSISSDNAERILDESMRKIRFTPCDSANDPKPRCGSRRKAECAIGIPRSALLRYILNNLP